MYAPLCELYNHVVVPSLTRSDRSLPPILDSSRHRSAQKEDGDIPPGLPGDIRFAVMNETSASFTGSPFPSVSSIEILCSKRKVSAVAWFCRTRLHDSASFRGEDWRLRA